MCLRRRRGAPLNCARGLTNGKARDVGQYDDADGDGDDELECAGEDGEDGGDDEAYDDDAGDDDGDVDQVDMVDVVFYSFFVGSVTVMISALSILMTLC